MSNAKTGASQLSVNDINIKGVKFEITDAIETLIRNEFESVLDHYARYINGRIDVYLKTDHKTPNDNKTHKLPNQNMTNEIAEVSVEVLTKTITATAATDDMYRSIDEMVHKLKAQLEKYKQTHAGHKL
jgi:ribosomal subunit interface protein